MMTVTVVVMEIVIADVLAIVMVVVVECF